MRSSQILDHWGLFDEGFRSIAQRGKGLTYEPEPMLKTLCLRAGQTEQSYIILGESHGAPSGFGIFEDVTPMFAKDRTFIIVAFYSRCGNETLTLEMLRDFQDWARQNGVKHLIMTTRRHSGAAIRKFTSPKFGFSKTALVFEKEI